MLLRYLCSASIRKCMNYKFDVAVILNRSSLNKIIDFYYVCAYLETIKKVPSHAIGCIRISFWWNTFVCAIWKFLLSTLLFLQYFEFRGKLSVSINTVQHTKASPEADILQIQWSHEENNIKIYFYCEFYKMLH